MEIYCDGERIYLARNYRVEGISKREFIEKSEINILWQSEKLSETPKKLANTRYYLIGAGGSKLIKMDRRSGETIEIDAEDEIRDIATDLRNIYFCTAEGIYRVPAERFSKSHIVKLSVSDLLDKPIKSIGLFGDNLFAIGGNFIYKLTVEGEKILEKAFGGGIYLTSHPEGIVAVKEGEVVYFTDDLEVLSSSRYEGSFIKMEHGSLYTFLLTDTSLNVYGKTGSRYAHIENAHYDSFTEGLNHIYLYDKNEDSLNLGGKKDLLGDNFTEIDLTTLIGIIMGSLILAERKISPIRLREEKGYIDVHIKDKHVPIEKVILKLTKYFPELFHLYKNPGYYEEIENFGSKYDIFIVEDKNIRLNSALLERLIDIHSSFKAFKEDIEKAIASLYDEC